MHYPRAVDPPPFPTDDAQGAVAISLPILLPDPITGVPSVPTAFVFVTCHLASDMSGAWRTSARRSLLMWPTAAPSPAPHSRLCIQRSMGHVCGCARGKHVRMCLCVWALTRLWCCPWSHGGV